MKYIRTKDGIYEACEDGETYNGFGCKTKKGTIKIHKKDVVKQTDSLEELCDYVWYKEKHHEKMLERICTNLGSVMKQPRVDGAFEYVRLMILVGKDLKTVAEMNEKGEWELL